MTDGGEYVTRREFDASTKYYDRALADISRQAHEDRVGLQEELRRLGDKIDKPQNDPAALAMHHAADAMGKIAEKLAQPPSLIEAPRGGWMAPAAGGGSFIGLVAMVAWQIWGPK